VTPGPALTPDAIADRLRDAVAAGSPAGDGPAVLDTEITQDIVTVTVARPATGPRCWTPR